jgi:hypothetical protein
MKFILYCILSIFVKELTTATLYDWANVILTRQFRGFPQITYSLIRLFVFVVTRDGYHEILFSLNTHTMNLKILKQLES